MKLIYPTDYDIDVMDRQTKKDILAHNRSWHVNCQKRFLLEHFSTMAMIKPYYNLKNSRALKGYFMSTINPPGSVGFNDASLLNTFNKAESCSSLRIKNGRSSDQLTPVSELPSGNSFLVKNRNEAVKVVV